MHLIAPLISGVRNADSGYAKITRRGTSVLAGLYSSFEGDSFPSSSLDSAGRVMLDAYGRAEVYVNEVCNVTVYDADGTQQIVFTAGYAASAIEVRSQSFTGSEYDGSASAAGSPINLQAVLDLWLTHTDQTDWGTSASLPIFVVTDPAYGAVGDGVTDDTTAIQAALTAAAASGGIVFFPANQYRVTSTLSAGGVTLYGAPAAYLFIDHATQGLLETQGTTVIQLTLQSFGSGTVIDAIVMTRIADCELSGQGKLLTVNSSTTTVTDTIFNYEGQSASDTAVEVGGTAFYATRCIFKAPETYNPSSGGMVYGNNLYLDACTFSAATTTAGTFSYIKLNTTVIKGNVAKCLFGTGSGTTIVAMELGTYASGSRFYEIGNAVDTGVTMYSYTPSGNTSGVELGTRERRARNMTDNGATIAVPTDQYGLVVISSTNTAAVLTGTLPPYGATGTVVFYHPSGGAGTAQPTTNFFGATAATTANTSTHVWSYVCGKPNTELRMLIAVDGKALGNGVP